MIHPALLHCLAEIASIERYAGPEDLGALLGWADWLAEAMAICGVTSWRRTGECDQLLARFSRRQM